MRAHANFYEVDWIIKYCLNKEVPIISEEFKELTFMRYFDLVSMPKNYLIKK